MSDDDKNDAIDFFKEIFQRQGVAVSTVSDGHILMFKREWLQSLLDNHPDKKELLIMIKRPDFKNAN